METRAELDPSPGVAMTEPGEAPGPAEPAGEWVRAEAAAQRLGIEVSRVRKLAKRGLLKGRKVGNGYAWEIEPASLQEELQRREAVNREIHAGRAFPHRPYKIPQAPAEETHGPGDPHPR